MDDRRIEEQEDCVCALQSSAEMKWNMGKGMEAKAYDFFKEVKQYVDRHGMLEPGEGVIAGVSGGADSMCLLHILCALRQEYGFELFVVHVNHGIRGADADMDQAESARGCPFLLKPCVRMCGRLQHSGV